MCPDYDRCVVHSYVTLPNGEFMRMKGTLEATRPANLDHDDRPERNKAMVLDAASNRLKGCVENICIKMAR